MSKQIWIVNDTKGKKVENKRRQKGERTQNNTISS